LISNADMGAKKAELPNLVAFGLCVVRQESVPRSQQFYSESRKEKPLEKRFGHLHIVFRLSVDLVADV
jgi:hypothetical protein